MRRWNGWGDDRTHYQVSDFAREYLVSKIGEGAKRADATLEEVLNSVPESRLPPHKLVINNAEERLRHARGQGLPDWIDLRSGRISSYPDGVIFPKSEQEVRDAIEFALNHELILIPYGGGTSVVRHINPPQGEVPVVTIDLSLLNQLQDLDETSHLATFQTGVRGPEIENQINRVGYTVGHFPQSFEYSTLGGWIATRSSGQQSYYYGRIEDIFRGGHLESPQGSIELKPFPASAAGPDLRHMLLGSEGRLGIITRATVALHPLPEIEGFYGVFFHDWEDGFSAVKKLAQMKSNLSMIRLSDALETETTLILAGKRNTIRLADIGLKSLGYHDRRCLLILGITGPKGQAIQSRNSALQICRKLGGFNSGTFIGKEWLKSRFLTPYLRNSLWETGYALDTLETALPWEKVLSAKEHIIRVINECAENLNERMLVFGHLSHIYRTGASIYITFIFSRSDDPDENLNLWREIKRAASQAVIDSGGTISHHHGIGQDHAPYLEHEKGQLGMHLIKNMGELLDPKSVMNPDVLFK